MHLNSYLEDLEKRLPIECSERDLSNELRSIFGSVSNISRKRKAGLMPPYLKKGPGRYIYLRQDILDFIKNMYTTQNSQNKNHT